MEQDRHISSYDIAEELDVDHKTVLPHLRKSEYKIEDNGGLEGNRPRWVFATGWNYRFWPLLSATDEVKKRPDLISSQVSVIAELLGTIKVTSKEHCEYYLSDLLNQKSQNFYRNGIMALPTWWQQVDQNGTYIL